MTETRKNKLGVLATRYGTLMAMIVVFIFFAIVTERFLLPENLLNIVKQTSILIVVALGVTVCMGVGEFDLCTGDVVCVGTILCAHLMANKHWGLVPTIVFVIFIGVLIGTINGFFVVKVGIPSMITTLAMSNFLSGLATSITKGKAIYGSGIPQVLLKWAAGSVGPISNLTIVGFIFVVVTFLFLNRSVYGRYIYACSGNPHAASLSGVNVGMWRWLCLITCSTFCMIAGVLLMARLGTGNATAGSGYTMQALSAVFIGMTCIRIGRPNVLGTIIGAFLIAFLENGLNMMGVTYYYQEMVSGVVMLAAITITAMKTDIKF